MNKILRSCRTLLTLMLFVYFLAACGSDKQPATSTEQAPAPVTSPEQAAQEDTTAQSAPMESQVEVSPEPEEKATATQTQTTEAQAPQEAPSTASDTTAQHDDMLALAKKSGCMACHAVDKKIVGPAWTDVAKRYAGNAGAREQLIEKVAKGGKGNWTEVVGSAAMPPYHPRVSKENIAKLVDFVLSLPN